MRNIKIEGITEHCDLNNILDNLKLFGYRIEDIDRQLLRKTLTDEQTVSIYTYNSRVCYLSKEDEAEFDSDFLNLRKNIDYKDLFRSDDKILLTDDLNYKINCFKFTGELNSCLEWLVPSSKYKYAPKITLETGVVCLKYGKILTTYKNSLCNSDREWREVCTFGGKEISAIEFIERFERLKYLVKL